MNLHLTAIRKLAREAAIYKLLDPETAAHVLSVENVRQTGLSRGSWLNLEQAQALILEPDVTKLKGIRDRAILAILVGCGLRREEATRLTFEDVEQRDGRWVIVDLRGKRGRIRTVPMPAWVKVAIDYWSCAAQIKTGRILRAMRKGGYVLHDTMTPEAVLHLVEDYGRKIGIAIKAHDLRRSCAALARKSGGQLEQIQLLLGHSSLQTTERYLGTTQDLERAPNDRIDLGWRREQRKDALVVELARLQAENERLKKKQ